MKSFLCAVVAIVGSMMSLAACLNTNLDTSCDTVADCRRYGNCCIGCKAINVDEEPASCDSVCIVPPCDLSPAGLACIAGECQLVDL